MSFDIRSILGDEKDIFRFLDLMNEGLIVVDLNEEIQYVNRKFCEITGYEESELIGQNAVDLFIREDKLINRFQAATEERKELRSSSFEVEMFRKDGERIYVINSGSPVTDRNGNVVGSMGILMDITKTRKDEQRLLQINRELSTFIYKVSHDLKGPIATTKGITNIVRTEAGKSLQPYVDMLDTSIDKLNDVVDDLINIVFVRDGEINPGKVDLKNLCEKVCSEFELKLQKIQVSKSIVQTGEFRTDPRFLRSVFRNVLQNAINYNDSAEPEIVVSMESNSEMASIVIRDNGIGIEEKHLDKIYDMFYRGTDYSSGSGLGLYIVKQALDKLSGEIEIHSNAGKGTEVRIKLKSL